MIDKRSTLEMTKIFILRDIHGTAPLENANTMNFCPVGSSYQRIYTGSFLNLYILVLI